MENFKNKKIIGIILTLSLVINLFLFLQYNNNNNNNISGNLKYKLLNPARKIYDRENLIINFQPLRDELMEMGTKNQNLSIYFEYLPTGANVAVNKDTGFFPASLLKIPVALAVYKKIENGLWKTSDSFVLQEEDKDSKFGNLYKSKTGTKFTIEELLYEMLSNSDNTAYEMLLKKLETWELNEIYGHVGLDSLASVDGLISAKRYAVFLRSLFNAVYLSDDNSQKILATLTKTPFNEMLAGGVPPDITIAHKIGVSESLGVYMDAGIVYSPKRPYLIVVMIKDSSKENAYRQIKIISEKVYKYVIFQKND